MVARGGGGPSAVVVLDNGAGNCKIGIGGEAAPRRVFPNCTAKPKGEKAMYVGDMLLDPKSEISQLTLRRPFDRGYLVTWDLEKEIWAHAFKSILGLGRQPGNLTTRECGLLLSEPIFNFPAVQQATEQVIFEDFGFHSYHAAPAPIFSLRRMAALNPQLPAAQAGAGIVIDAGFSFTHIVPFFDWSIIPEGVKRINLGGKALTNYLKELVSYRSLNMMDEPYLMEVVKEAVCFVSQDVRADLKAAATRRGPYRREYVLPDGVNSFRGYVREPMAQQAAAAALAAQQGGQAAGAGQGEIAPGQPHGAGPPKAGAAEAQQGDDTAEAGAGSKSKSAPAAAMGQEQVLMLNNERFMVPEVLFNPSDIGLNQAGVAEAVLQAVQGVHPALQPLLFNNVILTGGVAGCPGFSTRFTSELQPMVLDDCALGVHTPPNPGLCAWEGMSMFVASGGYAQVAMTRAQYEETGGSAGRGGAGRW